MRPSQVSSVLRQIATKITNSKNPRRDLVSKDLEFVLSKLAASEPEMKVLPNGTKEWKLNGKLHREDGPAVEKSNGTKFWWLDGELHRENGPAIEYPDGTKEWFLNGKRHREDGPAVEQFNGTKQWCLNGKFHRENGPAIEYPNGSKYWFLNGLRHREDGPAIERSDGTQEWFLNGKQLTKRRLISDIMKRTYPEIYESYLAYQIMIS